MDLAPFAHIDPCGYPGLGVTRLVELGVKSGIESVRRQLLERLLDRLGYNRHVILQAPAPCSRPARAPIRPLRTTPGIAEVGQCRSVAEKGADKVARIPVKVVPQAPLRKPQWIRARSPTHPEVGRLKVLLREHRLNTVCEEASCPNLGECFAHGTATFMIMGRLCTRRCPFCDVAHGRPLPLDPEEPAQLASAIAAMNLNYVVITSVDRDDLRDGGASHFVACIEAVRARSPATAIEVLVPDFRGRLAPALETLAQAPPDVLNHNLETVPRLYKAARPARITPIRSNCCARSSSVIRGFRPNPA